ncbi:MAG: sigma-70 family RNA polymerase sigma factor [Deltaproteobacteria bacterium]|nr:sigma-70 family RNA polymerase sigma factor [Deltaproteobacteria bacterium]
MHDLGEHFFRRAYGRLVALLSRRQGVHQLEAVEDAVQFALAAAVETWPTSSVPDNPEAWLFRVAHNHLVDEARRSTRHERLAVRYGAEAAMADAPPAFLEGEVRDDLLRMLFACCDDALPVESQLVLALKVLSGFDVREIAERLFMSEANVYKRLGRARQRLREVEFELADLTPAELASRLPAVQTILYVLFTEGYLSSHADGAIRRELCDDAIRLTHELAEHPVSAAPETFALLALMHLHAARLPARQDGSGGLLLLEEQDRSRWNQREIETGLVWLARSAEGATFSRYHAEAGIAAEHCLAPTLAETRWERIVACYSLLDQLAPSALHSLNRAVALAEWQGPLAGLALLDGLSPPSWLIGSYLWDAVLADLHLRAGHGALAEQHRAAAIASAPSAAVRAALERRLRSR